MKEFFKTNPIALRHSLLYVFLQKKSIDTAFDDFCKTVGPDVIKKEEFRFWFHQFRKGIIYLDEEPVDDLKEFIRNDKHARRVCVLYESLCAKRDLEKNKHWSRRKKPLPVFSKYKNFCKIIGDNVMEYLEFDFWFYRFLNGEFDLKIEWDKEKKILELSEMPIDVMRNIVEYLDFNDRLALERTSRSFKTFSEDQKLFHENFEFSVYKRARNMYTTSSTIIEKRNDDYYIISENGKQMNKKLIEDVPFWRKRIQELESILKYPKLRLDVFKINLLSNFFVRLLNLKNTVDEAVEALKAALKSSQQRNVKKLSFSAHSMKPLLKILPSLKPGYLSTIEIKVSEPEPYPLEELVGMEQWKQAKHFVMSGVFPYGFRHNLYHFKEFTVRINELTVEDIREMKEILFKSPAFEKCAIQLDTPLEMNAIRQEFGDPIQGSPDTYHYPISNSTEYFEIRIYVYFNSPKIEIARKNK